MSSKQQRDSKKGLKNSKVTSRCVAIVFDRSENDEKADENNEENGFIEQENLHPNFHQPQENGTSAKDEAPFDAKTIFEEFRLRNKTCYWNPALVDSVKSLEYVGFIEPFTILVRGDDIHLENVRTAWGRRVLKNPAHYNIVKIGDVNGIEMQEIPQTQFIPLPEALCLIIMDLNNCQIVATLDTVCEKLKLSYQGHHLPSNQHVYDTLGQLIRERKVFHTGCGYFVVTPDTFRFHGDDIPTTSLFSPWTHLHPMYIPAAFSQPPRQPTRSISCQVDAEDNLIGQPGSCDKEEKSCPYEEILKVDLPMPRVHRSMSLSARHSRDKTRKEDAGGGEGGTLKRSSSVKGRSEKNKASVKDVDIKTGAKDCKEEKPKEKVSLLSKLFGRSKKKTAAPPPEPQKPAVEYATFSAQFPPPEWTWYQQQIDKQIRTETWVQQQMVKSGTWHYLQSLPTDSGTGSLHFGTNSVPDRIPPVVHHTQPHAQTMPYGPPITRRSHKKSHKQKHRSSIVIANTQQDMNTVDPFDKHTFKNSMGQTSLRLSSLPTRLSSPTGEVLHSNYVSHPLFNSTPRYGANHEAFFKDDRTKPTLTEERKEGTGKSKSHKKGHRSKKKSHPDRHSSVYPMTRHISGMSTGLQHGEDISFEYQGQLPKKHSAIGVSHNSGVNCIGLEEQQQHTAPRPVYQRSRSYRHTVTDDRVGGNRQQYDFTHDTSHRKSHYQRSRSYRHTVSQENFVDAKHLQSTPAIHRGEEAVTDVHIYANVHVSNTDTRPKVPERTHRKPQDSRPDRRSEIQTAESSVATGNHLSVQLPECDRRSEHNSDRGTVHSSSSADPSSHDSVLEGTASSEHSMGTVINTQSMSGRHVIDKLVPHLGDFTLGDSGFSSPRVSENSQENKKLDCNIAKEQNSFMCNNLKLETKLNNSNNKLDESSEDSYGRITSDTLYENVKINHKEVLNNMKYLHKEINVSSQNLTRQSSLQEGSIGSIGEVEYEPKQAVVKKFNFEGDFHVVGVV